MLSPFCSEACGSCDCQVMTGIFFILELFFLSPFRSLCQTLNRALLPALTHVLRTVLSSTAAPPWTSPHQDSQSVELVRTSILPMVIVLPMVELWWWAWLTVSELCDLWQTTSPLQRCGYFYLWNRWPEVQCQLHRSARIKSWFM